MKFDEYQRRAAESDQAPRQSEGAEDDPRAPSREIVVPLLGLVGEIGGLASEYKKLLRDGATHRKFKEEIAEELGDILWYVSNLASKFDLSLNDVAQANLAKVEERYLRTAGQLGLLDGHYDVKQQLPRSFEYRFEHRDVDGIRKLVVVDLRAGDTTGDPLTDNTYEDDGYRYHDAMHLAFVACLGWSPVWRKLLRRRRQVANRTPADVDDAEDGGRAQVVEEAIVAAVYAYASDHDFLEGVDAVDWQLLRHIKRLTAKTEVRATSTGEWNRAIIVGFTVWRALRSHGGGVVRGDLTARTLEFVGRE